MSTEDVEALLHELEVHQAELHLRTNVKHLELALEAGAMGTWEYDLENERAWRDW